MYITKQEIIDDINEFNLKTDDDVEEVNNAGGVCGTCKDEINEILKELNN
jgi:NAD(P)H-nitrite reductase large subunit